MERKKTTKTKETTIAVLEDYKFLDKYGNEVRVVDVIDKTKDCWFLRNKSLWILTHAGVEKLAKIAGISSNYDVEESQTIIPTYQNELEHIVRVTMKCNAKGKKPITELGGCVHSDENTLTVTGEANRINTPNRGRGYLRKMAEKRAWDIAVLKHLGLYSAIFSEDEAEEFKNPNEEKDSTLMPGSKEFEAIAEEINLILSILTKTELKETGKIIKTNIAEGKYSEKQEAYLRSLFKKQVAAINTDL